MRKDEVGCRDLPTWYSAAAWLVVIGALLAVGPAAAGARFPKELRGTWDLGPERCRLPVSPDSDSPIHIHEARIDGYENIDTPVRIRQVSTDPLAWRVTSTSNIAPGMVFADLYVLKGEHLTITNGETTSAYRRCR